MDSNQIWNLLGKYFAGEANSQERQAVEEWLAKSDENQRIYNLFKSAWDQKAEDNLVHNIATDKYWADTQRKLKGYDSKSKPAGLKSEKPMQKSFIKYAAAAVFIFFALLSGIFLYQNSDVSDLPKHVFKSDVGESLDLELSDGSEVVLAPGSKLSVSNDFNSSIREVSLEGEAYFSVERDTRKPFQIHTETSVTTVLGTKFNVSAYPENLFDEVIVIEGSVSVKKAEHDSDNQAFVLRKNDLAKIGERTDEIELINTVDTQTYLKWMEGIISIEDIPMSEVIKKLERWYPVNFSIQTEELANKKLTAEFSSKQSLTEILDAISLVLKIEYKRDQQEVIFYK